MRRLPCLLLLAAVLSCLSGDALAQVQVQSLSPLAVPPGHTTEVLLRGQKLAGPLRVWTSLPAQIEVVASSAQEAKLKVTLPADTPAQLGGLVIGSKEGVSEPLCILIDDLPNSTDNGQNHTLATAQEVTTLAAIAGIAEATQSDYYKFTAKAGERIAVEIFAARLGSPLDALVRLLDSNGQELLTADDDAGHGADSRLAFTVPSDGAYLLEVRDVRYRGGADYRYHLRVGDFPLVTTPYPLGITAGQSSEIGFTGVEDSLPGPRSIVGATAPRQPLSVQADNNGRSSALTSLIVSSAAQQSESEPNDTIETATKIALPSGISGRFAQRNDRDFYEFDAVAGTSLLLRPVTHSVGSPCRVMMAVYKPDGGLLAELKASDSDEEPLVVTFPVAGKYRLGVEELLRQHGSHCTYYIDATPHAGCALFIKPDPKTPGSFALPTNGTIALDVQAARSGYTGPITLAIEPASAGFVLRNHIIAEKQNATRLILIAPPGAQPGDLHAARIVGHVEHQGQKFSIPVTTTALIRMRKPQLAYPPTWLDGLFPIAITSEIEPLFTLTPATPALLYPRSVAEIVVPLNIERKQKEHRDLLAIAIENVPAGVTAEVKNESKDGVDKVSVVVKAPPGTADGEHELRVVSFGEFKGRGQQVSTALPVKFITPVSLSVAPLGNITPGQKQKVKITITRYQGDKADPQPVVVSWKALPPGVTTDGETTLAPEQTEVEVEFSAAADAKLGVFEQLVAQAATTFQGQAATSDSPATKWEVK